MMKLLAWVGFFVAIIGGTGLVGEGLASAVLIIAALGAFVLICIDCAKNRLPDMYAYVGAFVLPSLIVKIGGPFPAWIDRQLNRLWDWASGHMGDWVATSTVGLALAAVVISFLVASRTSPSSRIGIR
ncbi:hypothetical protein [Micromonospora sp. NPDC005174]|uniref:hypothetical protein n=1 Tax=Micromonospora sp. NPDC005174 TaxID=3157018 RepID=UPI00339F4D36